jgi:membrane-associated phospholipid phosphatase
VIGEPGDQNAERAGQAGRTGRTRQTRPAAPLLPAWARRRAAITALCCALLVAVLGVLAAHQSHGNAVDGPVDSWIVHHLGSHRRALSDITDLGEGPEVTALTTVLVLACLAARRVNGAVLAVVSVAVAAALTEFVLKPLVHETINGSLSYPSGHATGLFALVAVVGVLMLDPIGGPRRKRPRPGARMLLVLGLVAVGCVVAVALIGLKYHYFTDTVAGAAAGIGVALTTPFPLDRSGVRRRLRAGASAGAGAPGP